MIERYSLPEMSAVWQLQNKFQKWLDIELAACEAHHQLGNISDDDLATILSKASFSLERINEIEKETHHDVIAFLTSVAESIGPESRFVHMGMTSSDVVDTANSLLLKQSGEILLQKIEVFIKLLKEKALETKEMLIVGRTHGIHAEPMTFGLKYVLWYEEMKRNKKRLEDAIETISIGVVSGAVGTYSNIDPQVEVYVCDKLGLKPASISTQIIQRDRHAQYMTTLAIIAASLEKMSLEVRNLQRTDVTEVSEPFGKGQKGSSAMPHKRNPILSERLNGLARVMRGYAMTSLENIALWHERDISHSGAERVIFSDANILLDYMLHVAGRIFSGLEYYPQNMEKNMNVHGGIIFSQRVLLALISKGLTREDAYLLVQRNALQARDSEAGDFKQNLLDDQEVMKYFSAADIEEFFDPQATLKNVGLIYDRVFNT